MAKVEPTRRTEIRGRIAYDEELQRFRILEDEMSQGAPEEYYGRYFYFKEVGAHDNICQLHACINFAFDNKTVYLPHYIPHSQTVMILESL